MYPSKYHPKIFLICLFIITEIIGILSTATCIIWSASYHGGIGFGDYFQLINLHALLMPFSTIILTGNGMVIFRLVSFCHTKTVKRVHALLHIICFFILFAGIASAVFAKESYSPNLGHLFTFHSWMGVFSIFLYFLNLGLAILIFFCKDEESRESYAGIHSFIGIANFLLSTATVCVGIAEKTILFIPNVPSLPTECILGYVAGLGFIIFTANIFYITVNPFFEWEKTSDV